MMAGIFSSPALGWVSWSLFGASLLAAGSTAAGAVWHGWRERARRWEVEMQLRQSRERYQLALAGMEVGLWEYNLATGETQYGERWQQLFGPEKSGVCLSRDEWLARVHPEDRPAVEEAFEAHYRGETEHFEKEYRRRCQNGIFRWVHSRGQLVNDDQGRRVRLVGSHTDITERKRSERAVRASEERYRRLFEQNPSPMFVFDRETLYILEFNSSALRLYGYTREEFAQMTICELCEPETAVRLERELTGQHSWTPGGVWPHRRKDGALVFVEACVQPQEYAGRPGALVVALDVTQRHFAEMRYRELFENASEGVYECTREGTFRSVNPAFARMLGYADAEALLAAGVPMGRDFYVAPGRREELIVQLGGREAVHNFESEVRRRDGSILWIVENVRAVRGERGEIQFFQGFVSDVTARRQADAALAAERERLSVTLRAMTEGVITTDVQGVVRFFNEAAERLTGWAASEAVGQPLTELCVLHQEGNEEEVVLPRHEQLAASAGAELPPHTRLSHRSGATVLVDGRMAALHGEAGRSMGAVLVLRDMTERARLEAELLRTSKLESLGLLAGGIAHDFNNLLTIIMGNVTLAKLDSQASSSLTRWLGEAEKGVMRTRELTQQLLTFAKGGNPVRAAVPLQEVVREVTEFALHGSKVSCTFQMAGDLWPANVDKGQIGQVVQNLVINAVQAMPEGGRLTIGMHNAQLGEHPHPVLIPGAYLRISIADTGTGIRPEHLEHIFDPYFTTKAHGTGLGLATVYSIVKKHQGHIEVDSVVGRGTIFHLWLPAVFQAGALVPAVPVAPHVSATPWGRRARVLVMDDEEPIRRLAVALLERLGHDVRAVGNGQEVVAEYLRASAAGTHYDVVVLDLTVPGGMGGLAALKELRQQQPEVRAIVSSGYSSDPVMANFRAYGFQGVVPKPYKIEDFSRTVQAVLAQPPRETAGPAPTT